MRTLLRLVKSFSTAKLGYLLFLRNFLSKKIALLSWLKIAPKEKNLHSFRSRQKFVVKIVSRFGGVLQQVISFFNNVYKN
jgi:hypothetical protein